MAVICPAILADSEREYSLQLNRVKGLAKRIQIDLTDGTLTDSKTIGLDQIWWQSGLIADIHLMYKQPMEHLDKLIGLRPNMVIIHAEAEVHHMHFAAELHKEGVKAGLAVLPDTSVESVEQIINSFDHLLIFGGHLGHFGGKADLSLLEKSAEAKAQHPDIEVGWDGGVDNNNAWRLVEGGVDVLNVGGFIQKSADPAAAYAKLESVIRGNA